MALNVNETKLRRDAEWIELCEKRFSEQFFGIAEDICKRKLRIVRLYGPSCSGKTTAARLLIDMFESLGKKAHLVSIDDFYFDRDVLLRMSKEKGLKGVDYDSPDTIDTAALHKFASEIFEANEAECPVFDFKSGTRSGYKTYTVSDDDIFIFEGIQACYTQVKQMLSEYGSASVFIAPMKNINVGGVSFSPNRLRLMRRLVRDYNFRGSTPEFTFSLWKSVRDNEKKNIFPHTEDSEYFIDSAMPYEVGVLKPFLKIVLENVGEESEYYEKSRRILESVAQVEEISSELILDEYLYSEFV